jgi:hypothetical protein
MNRWAIALAAVFATMVIGGIGYQLGVSHGLALGAQASGGAAAPYMYYRPWGFGFGFFFPFAFFAFWFLIARGLFWGRRGWHRERLEEWHRRAHEQMSASSAPDRARS